MKPEVFAAKIQIESDRGFEAVGEGARNFIYWQGEYSDYLFYTPRLLLVKQTRDHIKTLKGTKIVPMGDREKSARINAIIENRRFATRGKYWDGGDVADEVIAMLQNKTVSERVFIQHEGPTKPFAQFDKGGPKVATNKGLELKEKDRVYIFGDNEKIGTIVKVGDEVSEIKWDDKTVGNVTNTNLRLVTVEKIVEAKTKAEKAAAKQAAKDAKKAEKAAEREKAKAEKAKKNGKAAAPKAKAPSRKANIPEGRIVLKPDKWATKDNPRKAGTKANARCGEMIAYMKKNPKAQAQEVIAKTGYRVDDLLYDIAHKFIEVKK